MTGRAAALIVAIGFVGAVGIYFARQAQWQIDIQERMLREVGFEGWVYDQRTREMEESLGTENLMAVLWSMGTGTLIIILFVLLRRNAIREMRWGERDSLFQFSISSMLAVMLALSLICSAIIIPVPWRWVEDPVELKAEHNRPWVMSMKFVEKRVKEIANTQKYEVVFVKYPLPNISKLEDGSYLVEGQFSIKWSATGITQHDYTCHLEYKGGTEWECKSLDMSNTFVIKP